MTFKTITIGFKFRANDAPLIRQLRWIVELAKMRRDHLAFEAQLEEAARTMNASREQMKKWAREAREVEK